MNTQETHPITAIAGRIHIEVATLNCVMAIATWLVGLNVRDEAITPALLGVVPELRHAAGAGGYLAVALRPGGLEAFLSDSRAAVDAWMQRAVIAGDNALAMAPARMAANSERAAHGHALH